MKIELLSEKELIKTGPVDHAEWNYKSVIKYFQRKRFKLCMKLIKGNSYGRLLEIGYGSGVFMPTLVKIASEVHGLDIHKKNNEVEKKLFQASLKVNLLSANATNIPFEDKYFDLIISVSTIEFINELDAACKEIIRVLKKGGILIVITPGYSSFLDLGLKILTKQNAKLDYEDRRKDIIPTLMKHFKVEEKITFPKLSFPFLRFYYGLKLATKEQ